MATSTSNLGLTLPSVNDAADIAVLNNNFQKIDALGGYGLGELAKSLDGNNDLNTLTGTGFFRWGSAMPKNAPFSYAVMLQVKRANGDFVQKVWQLGNGTATQISAERIVIDNSGEWEWVNPPMTLGVEYRTTERWNGAVVYVKMLDCGELSSTDQKLVTFASETTASAFQLYGRAYRSGGNMITLPYGEAILISGDNNRILIHTKGVSSGWYAYVGVKYTK